MNEKDYANKSWPGKLPKNWDSQITVEFQRTYRPEERPIPPYIDGNISRSILLPTVPGGEGNPDNELYEAWASVEVPASGDLELLPVADAGRKSLEGQRSVTWTIKFKLKSNVTQRANFTLIFKVHLRNKKTGVWATTPYDLGEEAIIVDWPPGTRGQAYLSLVLCFPLAIGMFGLSKRSLALPVPSGREVNAWLVDGQVPLTVKRKYKIGVNIGARREDRMEGGAFTEPDWGVRTELELLIALNSIDAEVTPEWQTAILPKYGDMKEVFFDVVPQKVGNISLSLCIYLARDLTLLEKFRLQLLTEQAIAAGQRS